MKEVRLKAATIINIIKAREGMLMKTIKVHPKRLIPTDHPRSLKGILKFVPLLINKKKIKTIVVVPASKISTGKPKRTTPREYYICSGNHRAAAAYICKFSISALVAESHEDLKILSEGRVSRCETIKELEKKCRSEAADGQYIKGRWEEYLRMITDSGVVTYEDPEDGYPWILEL